MVHITLALFLATFTYSLTVLRTVRTSTGDQPQFVPQVAVTVAFALALASVLGLVLFPAHLAREIRVETMLRNVHEDASETLQRVLPERGSTAVSDTALPVLPGSAVPLLAGSSGFLTRVDEQALLAAAVDADAVVVLDRVLGSSLIAGTPVGAGWPRGAGSFDSDTRSRLGERVAKAVCTGFERTAAQDVGFGLRQLTDVAIKALSPGINDPTTAVHALGHSSALLCELAGRDLGPRLLRDEQGELRVVLRSPSFTELFELAVTQPRRYGAGVTLVGVNATTGLKLLFTLALVLVVLALRRLVLALTRWVLGTVSIWVTPGTNLTTGLGLISAGLAFALQQVILALAGYFVILRGDTFGIGDRITLGGVRGDLIRLGFIKTTIMETGQPPSVSSADPAVWVNSRQYTGRLVTVTNGVIFKEPVYNYTREFPYIWEEIVVPVTYDADRIRAEQILLSAARTHAVVDDPVADRALATMRSRYAMADASLNPAVYWRITDNWLELSLRFLAPCRGVRAVKDRISRDVLGQLDAAGVGIASATYDIVGLPTVQLTTPPSD